MKFICTLPEVKHYSPLQSQSSGKYLWQDKASSLIRIVAPVPNPWLQEWVILPTVQKTKTSNSQYPARLDLKCFKIEDPTIPRAKLIREIDMDKFAYTQNSPALFYCFPFSFSINNQNENSQWLLYSFYYHSSS